MGVYIKDDLPTEFNGITMREAVYWANIYLQDNPCDRMWDAIRALRDFCECLTDEAVEVAEPKRGEWIIPDDDESITITGRCSACGWESHLLEDDVVGMPFCPNCGARMKGADDE